MFSLMFLSFQVSMYGWSVLVQIKFITLNCGGLYGGVHSKGRGFRSFQQRVINDSGAMVLAWVSELSHEDWRKHLGLVPSWSALILMQIPCLLLWGLAGGGMHFSHWWRHVLRYVVKFRFLLGRITYCVLSTLLTLSSITYIGLV